MYDHISFYWKILFLKNTPKLRNANLALVFISNQLFRQNRSQQTFVKNNGYVLQFKFFKEFFIRTLTLFFARPR